MKKNQKYSQILLGLLFYTLLVILWGAWVRISHSGDGCGDTWPLCHGQMIPEAQQGKTWVEYSHRMMSGLFGLLILALFFNVRKHFSKKSSDSLLGDDELNFYDYRGSFRCKACSL